MTNLWEFLLQTGTVTLTALLLLFCKKIFADKLSPRWQYGIWFLLAARILLPVKAGRYVLFPLSLLLETAKTTAELATGPSAYTAPYVPLSIEHPFPVVKAMPTSVTDWLFLLYGIGVVVSFVLVLIRYGIFLHALRQAADNRLTPARETTEALTRLWEKYRLPQCPIRVIPGLPSPFVCGFFKPLLVVPETVMDETVLLHELLHLRYRDVWQNLFWCALRSLHWCNPFIWYVCRRIGNDMESLCDTRVLERLEGEDRRHYGAVLLSMVREKYARVPGTTSISNGGKNIARRIDAIVRFKKYPAGMGIVSVCMALVLSVPLLWGSAMTIDRTILTPPTERAIVRSLAFSRLKRCSTIAGALDTYAKGLITSNGVLLAMSTPLENQESFAAQLQTGQHLPVETDFMQYQSGQGYRIFNLTEAESGCEALLVFPMYGWEDVPASEDTVGLPQSASLLIPVRVWQADGGWVVEESGERIRSFCDYHQTEFAGSPVPPIRRMTATGESGTVTVEERVWYQIDNDVDHDGLAFFSSTAFSEEAMPDVAFKQAVCHVQLTYDYRDNGRNTLPETMVGVEILPWDGKAMLALPLSSNKTHTGAPMETWSSQGGGYGVGEEKEWRSQSGSSNTGAGWVYDRIDQAEEPSYQPDHTLYWGSGEYYHDVEGPIELPNGYGIMSIWDTVPMELFLLSDESCELRPAREGGAG